VLRAEGKTLNFLGKRAERGIPQMKKRVCERKRKRGKERLFSSLVGKKRGT